jgi:hypothetical protein
MASFLCFLLHCFTSMKFYFTAKKRRH